MQNEKYKKDPLVAGNYYHIYNRGNNGQDIFFEIGNYDYFLKLYHQYIYPIAETYAWCLMKNHFHLLVYLRTENEILKDSLKYSTVESPKTLDPSKQFGHLFNAYTQAINKRYSRTGVLFEKPFERKLITSERYLNNLIYYIHNNPVHHGFVKTMADYSWSSYGSMVSDKPTKLQREEVLEMFLGRQNFVDYHAKEQVVNDVIEFLIE